MEKSKLKETDLMNNGKISTKTAISSSENNTERKTNLNNSLERATSSTTHRLWTRTVIIIAVSTLVYFYTQNKNKEKIFASVHENLPLRLQKFPCSNSYHDELSMFSECIPKRCGRFVTDQLIEKSEADLLRELAKNVISKVGSSGGASILDIHSGAVSYGEKFVNVYQVPSLLSEFQQNHLKVYNFVKSKIKKAIAEQFGISPLHLYLTYPTFFSRMTNAKAKTIHDEYWHEHVDKETYPSFHFTSLLYLNTYKKDFQGGSFLFIDGSGKNRSTWAVEPKKGRLIAFTSGEENRHHVEEVTEGERYAITIAFTCNPKLAIVDPKLKTNPKDK